MTKFRIIHISDWHAYGDEAAESLARWFKGQQPFTRFDGPGMVAVTGDMVGNFRSWRAKDFETEETLQRKHWERTAEHIQEAFPALPIVAVRGNHCYFNYAIPGLVQAFDEPGVGTVKVDDVVVSGFRGVPFHLGAWNDEFGDKAMSILAKDIPANTQVLLTHAPPRGFLDDVNFLDVPVEEKRDDWQYPAERAFFEAQQRRIGCVKLAERLPKLKKLRAHCFGHVHECGRKVARIGNISFSNAALGINVFDIEV